MPALARPVHSPCIFMYNNISDRLVENGCALKIQPPFRRLQVIQLPLRLEVLGHELPILYAN